jgi:hypothetical protein
MDSSQSALIRVNGSPAGRRTLLRPKSGWPSPGGLAGPRLDRSRGLGHMHALRPFTERQCSSLERIPQTFESAQDAVVPKRREREAEPAFVDDFMDHTCEMPELGLRTGSKLFRLNVKWSR